MIIRLTPEQVVAFWEAIKWGVAKANKILDSSTSLYCNNLLANLMTGKYQCWISYEDSSSGERTFIAVALTSINQDDLEDCKILMIHTLYAFRPIDQDMLVDGINALKQYAKSEGCSKIATYTENERLQKLLVDTGFSTMTQYFNMEV